MNIVDLILTLIVRLTGLACVVLGYFTKDPYILALGAVLIISAAIDRIGDRIRDK